MAPQGRGAGNDSCRDTFHASALAGSTSSRAQLQLPAVGGSVIVECILTYDVNMIDPDGERRLRMVARACEGLGLRVQKSVFEFRCSEAQLVRLLHTLAAIITSTDSVRVYRFPRGVLDAVSLMGKSDDIPIKGTVIW